MNRILFAAKWGLQNEWECLKELDALLTEQYNRAIDDVCHEIDDKLPFHCTTTEVNEFAKDLKRKTPQE